MRLPLLIRETLKKMTLQNINFSTRKILLFFQFDLRLSHKPALGKSLHWEKQFLHILNSLSGHINFVKFVYAGRNLNRYINNARSWSIPASTCSNRRFPPFWGLRYVRTRESTYTTKWLVIYRRLAFTLHHRYTLKIIFQFRIGKVSGIRGV